MSEAILLALWVGTSLFFVVGEIKAKENRENHELWLSELRECLHSIENEFSRQCLDITKSHQTYSSFLEQICKLEEEYINEVYNKVTAKKGIYFVKTLPDFIIREYERNISETADIYRRIKTINE